MAVVAEDEDEEEVADTAADGEEESEVVVDAVEGVAPIPVDEVSINQEGEGVEAEKNFFFLLQRNTHTHEYKIPYKFHYASRVSITCKKMGAFTFYKSFFRRKRLHFKAFGEVLLYQIQLIC